MANTDSFIEEVNEELRRDRLFALFRKWGWVPILLVLIVVGAAAWREYTMIRQRAEAQAFGDALIAAMANEDDAARDAALAAIDPAGTEAGILLTLLRAAEQATSENRAEAAAGLRALAEQPDLPVRYRDLALLKAQLLDPLEASLAMVVLDQLALPGRPYRPLAMEQQALVHIGQGDVEAALTILRLVEQDSQATAGLQQRASQLIVALESGASLQDAAPEEDAAATRENTGTEESESGPAAETGDGATPEAGDGAAARTGADAPAEDGTGTE